MFNYIVAGITQLETIIKVRHIPIEYEPNTSSHDAIHTSAGGDAFNISLALKWLGDEVKFMTVVGEKQDLSIFNPQDREVTLDIDYVMPVMHESPIEVLFYDERRKQQGFEDLKDKSVAVKIGTMSKEYADSLAEQYGFTVVTFESSPDVYQAVIGGQCVACFDDTPIMADYIKSNGVPLQLVDGTANEGADYGFAVFSPDKQELVDKFNAGLANIKASGAYDEILAKYLGE